MDKKFLKGLARDWGIALVVVVAVFMVWNLFLAPKPQSSGTAPDFVLNDLDGTEVALSSVDSELVVLNFWFTTCGPCRAEIPELSKWSAEHPDIPLYGISVDANMPTPKLKAISKKFGITYKVLHDMNSDVARKYNVNVFPTTFVLKNGEIASVRIGALDRHGLDALVAKAKKL